MINEYDVVTLKKDLPDRSLKKGDKGTVVMVYSESNISRGYEVEFTDAEGFTIALLTLYEEDIEKEN